MKIRLIIKDGTDMRIPWRALRSWKWTRRIVFDLDWR